MSEDLTILGKFKSVEALKNAYDNLQREFTKKCQKLSLLSEGSENCSENFDAQEHLDANVSNSKSQQPEQTVAVCAKKEGGGVATVSLKQFLPDMPLRLRAMGSRTILRLVA